MTDIIMMIFFFHFRFPFLATCLVAFQKDTLELCWKKHIGKDVELWGWEICELGEYVLNTVLLSCKVLSVFCEQNQTRKCKGQKSQVLFVLLIFFICEKDRDVLNCYFSIFDPLSWVFLVHVNIIWIYVMSRVCPSGRPAGCLSIFRGKNFNVGHYMQTVQPNCFISAMLIGTTFYLIRLKFDVVVMQFKLNILRLLSEI